MMSYRDQARDLADKVNTALERREELLKSYQDIKYRLRLAQAENDHFLDMISETFPEVRDDLSSSSDSADGLGAPSDDDDKDDDDNAVSPTRRPHKRSDMSPGVSSDTRVTKRRRRQGKRDDRSDPKPIEPIKRDSSGNIIFPMVVGRGMDEIHIQALGRIVWTPDSYHTSRYIWPVGFRSTRMYPSMRDNRARCLYTSEILDGGDMPVFQVTADDMPGEPFRASSSSGVWKQILDILMANGLGVKTHASGPQMYGLSHLAVTKAIQELDNAGKCKKYIMQRWISPSSDTRIKEASVDGAHESDASDKAVDRSHLHT
ncbi:hypothetical protein IWW45_005495 [Coemansia sp. RSA 485]|nr:hypothetical protein IWW45_005495 [Coemansia sp. RSA 485]